MPVLNPSVHQGAHIFIGPVSLEGGSKLTDGSIGNDQIAAGADIDASKLICHFRLPAELCSDAAQVAAVNRYLFTARAGGSLLGVDAAITGAIATGSDRTITIDLQKSTAGGAFATVLSATFGFTHTSTLLVPVPGVIADPEYVAGDIFRAVVTVAGAASAQAEGLGLTLSAAELYI